MLTSLFKLFHFKSFLEKIDCHQMDSQQIEQVAIALVVFVQVVDSGSIRVPVT